MLNGVVFVLVEIVSCLGAAIKVTLPDGFGGTCHLSNFKVEVCLPLPENGDSDVTV